MATQTTTIRTSPSWSWSPGVLCAIAAGAWGLIAAFHYHRLGLTLAHYDARAHLVVARRVFDSLTPGWQQVGAVWLPQGATTSQEAIPRRAAAVPATTVTRLKTAPTWNGPKRPNRR